MKRRSRKVLAYVVKDGELLVFTQPRSPEAGLQVPAGTIRDLESEDAAVLRELEEETGLVDTEVVRKLGVYEFDMHAYGRAEIQERHVYEIRVLTDVPRQWTHAEEHDGAAPPEPFSLFWLPLTSPRLQELEAGQGALLGRIAAVR